MSRLPLYDNNELYCEKILQKNLPKPDLSNAGLRFNKFCGRWRNDKWSMSFDKNTSKGNPPPKAEIIRLFARKLSENSKSYQNKLAQLKALNIRRNKMLEPYELSATILKTQGTFITGMGNPHPVENGFTWHHTLGVPYIPGSSVKGMVRDWAENWLDKKKPELLRIFGSDSKDNSSNKSIGSVIFHDVIPTKPVQLKEEIMTPHYGKYYEEGVVPGDWLSPVPIHFLAVDSNQEFHFMVTPRKQQNKQDAKTCMKWLVEAIANIGIGGKTSSGYGIFY